MPLLDRLVIGALPAVPKSVVHRVARRYVAGETMDSALSTVSELNQHGAMGTIDLLGEEVTERNAAEAATEEYLQLLVTLGARGLDSNISVKLTMLGLKIDEGFCAHNLERVVRRAQELANFVRIDMEDHTCTSATLRIYRQLQPRYSNLGVVLQAMLRRTLDDIDEIVNLGGNVRLCKGIYRESAEIAFQSPDEVRQNYLACHRKLLAGGCYVGLATHDEQLVSAVTENLQFAGLRREQYEFQMLLGVLPALRRKLIMEGHRVRVYVPYGAQWYAYSLRRLRENPVIGRHVLTAFFRRG